MMLLWQDIRYGLRRLSGNPGFTAVVLVILAVGIGANTAVFSVVNAVMLRPLPYSDAHRLVTLWERPQNTTVDTMTPQARFLFWREQNQVFEQMAAYIGCRPYVTGIDRPRYVWAEEVAPDVFPVLGVRPLLGRGFLPEEELPGKDGVVVLSHTFWREDFGGDPNVLGRTVAIEGKSHTVVGVMSPEFLSPLGGARAFWVPLVFTRNSDWPLGTSVFGLARLKKDTTLDQARAAMAVVAERLRVMDPNAGTITVRRILDRKLGANRPLLWLLLGAAGFVLLIACTNVASLLLARAAVRRREMALRVALGASRGRLLRQMLTEGLLLSLAGGVLGLLVTYWAVKGLVHLCPAKIPRLQETTVDRAVLGFTLAVSVLTGLLCAALPACRASDVRVSRTLQEGQTRSSTGRGWRRLHGGLVVAQTSLSLILLIGAALLLRTWITLQRLDLGFRPQNVMAVDMQLPAAGYPDSPRCRAFFESLVDHVRTLPGVRSAGWTDMLILGIGERGTPFSLLGQPPVRPEESPRAKQVLVTPGFFETLGMPVRQGRTLTEEDMHSAAHNVVIDENLVRQYFGDADPIGQRITLYDVERTIVGVVSTLRDFRHLEPPLGAVFGVPLQYNQYMTLLVRTDGDPLRLVSAIRGQIAALAQEGVDAQFETLEESLSGMLAPRRFSLVLLSLFAGNALALAAIGIYGLLQYSTAQQTHDIGIRMALGARRTDVLKAVLGHGLRLTLVGVVIGLGGAYALTRLLSSLLYGVPPTDPATFISVSLVLVAIALLASYLPARRAARIDPMVALRYE